MIIMNCLKSPTRIPTDPRISNVCDLLSVFCEWISCTTLFSIDVVFGLHRSIQYDEALSDDYSNSSSDQIHFDEAKPLIC